MVLALISSQVSFVSSARAATAGTGICQQTYTFSAGNESVAVVADGNYCYVAFKNLGAAGATASSYTWTKPSGITNLEVLVVGGGGGGGARHGGGGGAGSFVETSTYVVASASTSISIVVGSGGAGAVGGSTSYVGSKGGDSSFKVGANGLTALAGGVGQNGTSTNRDGGSGGGSGASQTAGVSQASTQKTLDGLTTISNIEFGNNGAAGVSDPNSVTSASYDYWAAGGGGGAGSAGKRPSQDGTEFSGATFDDGTGSRTRGGNGGDGRASLIIPSSVATSLGVGAVSAGSTYFAGGGGGGIGADGVAGGNGGLGGAGNGTKANAVGGGDATASTGSGGGGSGFDDISPVAGDTTNPPGGDGASGVVVVRYIPSVPTISTSAAISGTTTYGQTLNSNTGSWNYGPTSYTYQWSRSSSAGGPYTSIPSATSSTYVLTATDVGQYLKVAVTAINVVGSAVDTSAATSLISSATSSSSVTLAVGDILFRVAKVISATPNVAGKLTFRANKIIIPGCRNLPATANVAKTCSYRPSTRGYVTITVLLAPTDPGYSVTTATSGPYFVYQRTGTR